MAPVTQSWQSMTLSGTYTPLDSHSHILISLASRKVDPNRMKLFVNLR